jgi:hypothetical protein
MNPPKQFYNIWRKETSSHFSEKFKETTLYVHVEYVWQQSKTKVLIRTQANLDNDMHIKFFCVESNAFIESCALAIVEVHRYIYLHKLFAKLCEEK